MPLEDVLESDADLIVNTPVGTILNMPKSTVGR
jgi:hypothetical protein